MLPAARITDLHVCPMVTGVVPHVGGPDVVGGPMVMFCNMPGARISSMATCVGPPDVIVVGSPKVMTMNMPSAKMTSSTAHGGVVTVGAPTVILS